MIQWKIIELASLFLAGAYGRRAIGAGVFESLLLSRALFWCLPMQLTFVMHYPNQIVLSLVVAGAALLGISPGYFGGEFNLAEKRNRTFKNYARLISRGLFIALPIIGVLIIARYVGFYSGGTGQGGLIGALLPAFYLIGLKLEGRIKLPMVSSFSQWGEWMAGGAVMAGVGAAL